MSPKNDKSEEAATEKEPVEVVEEPVVELSPLETAQQEAGQNLAGWQRAQADYQNLLKESEQRMTDARKFATSGLLMELLPMVDHFKYALNGIPAEEKESAFAKGIEYIQSNFLKILEENGVEVIASIGQALDTELHEAIEEVEGKGKSGTVAEEMATGFKLNGKVIQCAKVKVYK